MLPQPELVTSKPQPRSQVIGTPARLDTLKPQYRKKEKLYGFGVAEIVLGGLYIILAIVFILKVTCSPNVTYAEWERIPIGAFIFITGVLGTQVKPHPTKCMYVANMTMAIISAYVTSSAVILSFSYGFGIGIPANVIALHITMAVIAFICAILSIFHAAFCCGQVCCKSNSESSLSTKLVQYDEEASGQFYIANQTFPLQISWNAPHRSIETSTRHYQPRSRDATLSETQSLLVHD